MKTGIGKVDIGKVGSLFFESAGEGLIVVDAAGIICVANLRMEELFGYTRHELMGKTVEMLIPDSMKGGHERHRKGYVKEPVRRSMGAGLDLQARRRDGRLFPVEVSLSHMKFDGQVFVMALITDISVRKKAEKELHRMNAELEQRIEKRTSQMYESQRLYHAIARNFPNGMISVLDKDLNYVFAEGMELQRLGITGEKLTGTSFPDRLNADIRDAVRDKLLGAFEGRSSSLEIAYRQNIYALNAVGLRDGDAAAISQVLVVEKNITRQKQAEENMRAALKKEQDLNEMKSRFVSMASHEFRTPLSTILSSVTLIDKYTGAGDAEKRVRHTARIRTSVHYLTNILNDFLSLDKLEQGKVESRPAESDIREMAEDVVEDMKAVTKDGQEIKFRHEGPADIFLDKQMVRNIFHNLLSNAIKYSPDGKPIVFHTSCANDRLTITVRDQGIGIPEDEQKRLFERFFRAGNATNIQGTGLGLNIVKKYLGLMGGAIAFESAAGEGTTFTVTLPQKMEDK